MSVAKEMIARSIRAVAKLNQTFPIPAKGDECFREKLDLWGEARCYQLAIEELLKDLFDHPDSSEVMSELFEIHRKIDTRYNIEY